MSLHLVPVSLREANAFVDHLHRHSDPVRGCLFVVGTADAEAIRGVAIVGRPIARPLQDGFTAEVLRCCTDGTRNACSILYGACWRGMKAAGYTRGVTYTLDAEGGASLKASGWVRVAELPPRPGWDSPGRERDNDRYLSSARWRWEKGRSNAEDRPPLPDGVSERAGQVSLL